jgi:Flp pilus assembly pilin Flp
LNRPDRSEDGQSTIEYTVVVTFLVLLLITVFTALSPTFRDLLSDPVSDEDVSDSEAAVSTEMYE